MKIGKIPETVLKRSVFKQIKHRRDEVLICPGVGRDCTAIESDKEEAIVISTDPITGTTANMGALSVHITANDIAVSGAEVIGIMLTILLPDGFRESELRKMMQDIEEVCLTLNIEVMGGHTEITSAVNQPVISVTGFGKIAKNELLAMNGMKPGQEIVMTKWAGLEGTAVIAKEREEELKEKYPKEFIESAIGFMDDISIVPEAKIGKEVGVTSMHDATEGGIYGALWEMAESSGVGLTVDLNKILMKQQTIEICEYYNINPYLLISSGCLLMSTDKGNDLVDALKDANISAAIIGKVTSGNDRVIINADEKRYLEPPKSDELYKVKLHSGVVTTTSES